MGNVFAWILFVFPIYLLVNGKLGSYLALARSGVMTSPPTPQQVADATTNAPIVPGAAPPSVGGYGLIP